MIADVILRRDSALDHLRLLVLQSETEKNIQRILHRTTPEWADSCSSAGEQIDER